MTPLEAVGFTLFLLVLFAGIFATLMGMPGTIIIFSDILLYALFTGFEKIGILFLLFLCLLCIIAEAADFAISTLTPVRFGASRQSIVASLIGSFAGAIVMTPLFFGFGMIFGAFLGGYLAVLIVEVIQQRKLKPAFRASYGALIGRLGGMFIKGFFSIVMIILTLSHIYS